MTDHHTDQRLSTADDTPTGVSVGVDTPVGVCVSAHTLATVPPPDDAMTLGDWENLDGSWGTPEGPFRHFVGSSWVVPARHEQSLGWGVGHNEIRIHVEGIQLSDGQIKRYITVTVTDHDEDFIVARMAGDVSVLPSASARLLSESLAYAHAEVMSWASVTGRAMSR